MQATITTRKLDRTQIPELLRSIPSTPKALFIAGTLPVIVPVAVVGSRKATSYGRRVASVVSARLAAAGVPIISGLAFGIDAAAHQAALDAGGQSVAVLPCGLAHKDISPRTNLPLAERIIRNGALLSEYPAGTTARKENFLARNRLISGFSRAVVVVEAALPSGSLITAKHAMEQGRDVWAVPGMIDAPQSRGTNDLIAQGAQPLVDIDHFIKSLGVSEDVPSRTGDELLRQFDASPKHLSAIAEASGMDPAALEAAVTKLELLGLIRDVGGRHYIRS